MHLFICTVELDKCDTDQRVTLKRGGLHLVTQQLLALEQIKNSTIDDNAK